MIQTEFNCVSTLVKSRGLAALAVLTVTLSSFAGAHHPDRECQPVSPRVDLIGPLGNRLPPSYRRTYNRPTYLGGKIAYLIAPSSQEAMAWHRGEHAGAYEDPKKCLRLEQHYFYPKPYQVLNVGARRPSGQPTKSATSAPYSMPEMLETEPLERSNPDPDVLSDPSDMPALELPEIAPSEESRSSSDSTGQAFWKVHVSRVNQPRNQTTVGTLIAAEGDTADGSRVSRQTEGNQLPLVDAAEKPVFSPGWLIR